MKNKRIICHECKKPISNRDELAVVGNAFLTYHNECFESIKHSNVYAFYSGYKINGMFTWIMLIILNSGIWGTFYFFDAPLHDTMVFSAFITSGGLLFRLVAYMSYERYL